MSLIRIIKSSSLPKTDAATAFQIYHRAVKADAYRVTSRKESGRTWHLNKEEDGTLPGYSPDKIPWFIIERLVQSNIEHLYLTPLSKSHHIVLIDDTNPEKIDAAKMAGVVFAYVQQTVTIHTPPFLPRMKR